MALARMEATGNGANRVFLVSFPYMTPAHVRCYVDGVELVYGGGYSETGPNTFTLTTAPASGAKVEFIRATSQEERLVDYQDTAILTEAALDRDSIQAFNMAQEALDAARNARDVTREELDFLENAMRNAATVGYVDAAIAGSRGAAGSLRAAGAVPDGVTPADAAIAAAMVSPLADWIVVDGPYRVTANVTITKAIHFEPGAYLTIDSGVQVTFANFVTSPRQFIFRGAGTVFMGGTERSRYGHASWWGAVTSALTDQTPAIQKCLNAFGNTRESIVDFDNGNYRCETGPILVGRATWIRGSGDRRTVFKAYSDGYAIFETKEQGCRFSFIQFEPDHPTIAYRTTAYWIEVKHNSCRINDCQIGYGNGINITGADCKVYDCSMGGNGPGSHGIRIAGPSASVRNFEATSVADVAVLIASGAGHQIDGIRTRFCTALRVAPGAGSVDGVMAAQLSGWDVGGSVLELINSGTGNIRGCSFSQVYAVATRTAGVVLTQSGAGTMEGIVIDGLVVRSITGAAFSAARTTGTMQDIVLSGSFIRSASIPLSITGNIARMSIDAETRAGLQGSQNSQGTYTYDLGDVADDAVAVINLGQNVVAGFIRVAAGHTRYGMFTIRASTTPGIVKVLGTADCTSFATALTGTTGTDGNLNVGVQPGGLIYVENRTGANARVILTIETGMALL